MFIRNKEGRVPVTVYLEDIAGKLEETVFMWMRFSNLKTAENMSFQSCFERTQYGTT